MSDDELMKTAKAKMNNFCEFLESQELNDKLRQLFTRLKKTGITSFLIMIGFYINPLYTAGKINAAKTEEEREQLRADNAKREEGELPKPMDGKDGLEIAIDASCRKNAGMSFIDAAPDAAVRDKVIRYLELFSKIAAEKLGKEMLAQYDAAAQ